VIIKVLSIIVNREIHTLANQHWRLNDHAIESREVLIWNFAEDTPPNFSDTMSNRADMARPAGLRLASDATLRVNAGRRKHARTSEGLTVCCREVATLTDGPCTNENQVKQKFSLGSTHSAMLAG